MYIGTYSIILFFNLKRNHQWWNIRIHFGNGNALKMFYRRKKKKYIISLLTIFFIRDNHLKSS